MGIIAITCYDCVCLTLIAIGPWQNFIPKIGGLLIGDDNPI